MSSDLNSAGKRASRRKPVYSKDQHPYYFGHYVNQARHNAYMIMADLAERFEVEVAAEDDLTQAPLLQLLDVKHPADETAKLIRALMRQFGFLRYLTLDDSGVPTQDVHPKDVKSVLYSAFLVLGWLRNEYSHFGQEHARLWVVNNVPFPLIDIYKGAVNSLKPRYGHYTDEHLDALWPSAKNAAIVPNDPGTEPYNHRALVYFTCLFLERAEASRFFGKLQGFQDATTLPRRAMLDAYREFCCRLPKPKLESGDVLLDMFNELGRCPGELYSSLSMEDRKQFDRTPEPEEDQDPEDVLQSLLIRHKDRFPWFALRYFDDTSVFPTLRFHIHLGQIAIEQYDKTINQVERERVLLRPIRTFCRWGQVDVTDLRRRLDSLTDERAKSKLLEKDLPKSWLLFERGIYSLRPEIEQFATRYRMDSNCIGFRFVPQEEQQGFPELSMNRDGKGRLQLPPGDQPDAVISTYELAALFLHQRLNGAEQTEAFLQEYIQRFRRLCADMKAGKLPPIATDPKLRRTPRKEPTDRGKIKELKQNALLREERSAAAETVLLNEYGLQLRYLPDTFREYLLGYWRDSYRFAAMEKLKAKRKDTRQLLKNIGYEKDERNPNILRLPKYPDMKRAPKSGEMGSWLADDMVFCKPPDSSGRGKPNDAQYRVLQRMLAYFGGYREQLEPFFVELGLTGLKAEAPHPFLDKILLKDCNGILDFYDRYLWARFDFIEQALKAIDPYYGKKPPKTREKQGLAEEEIRERFGYMLPINEKSAKEKDYSNQPVFLPRGLFNDSNDAKLRAMGVDLPADKRANMVYGLDRYSESATQPMYDLPRYVIPPGETGKRGEPELLPAYLEDLKRQIKKAKPEDKYPLQREEARLLDRERAIRYSQAMDRALWYMALDRASSSSDWDGISFKGLTLRDIEAVLTSEIKFHKTIGQVSLNDLLTIRRYGELRRLLKDRRLEDLMAHFTESRSVKQDEVNAALEQYERRRIPFFERIFKFEKIVFEHYESEVRAHWELHAKGNENTPFNHWDYLSPAYEKLGNPDALGIELQKMGDLRKIILHNEIPLPELFPTPMNTTSCLHVVDSIFDMAEGFYDDLLHLLHLPRITLTTFVDNSEENV